MAKKPWDVINGRSQTKCIDLRLLSECFEVIEVKRCSRLNFEPQKQLLQKFKKKPETHR